MVFDPFLGSGSTAAAAEVNNRRWIGVEKNPEYVEIAKRRIETGNAQKKFKLV